MRSALACHVLTVLLFSAAASSLAQSAKPNTVTFQNRTGLAAVVRVFSEAPAPRSRKLLGELAVADGGNGSLQLASGTYYHVVKFISRGKPRYSKAAPFTLNPPAGQYVKARITLHKVIGGNLASRDADASEFEDPPVEAARPATPPRPSSPGAP